MLALTGKAAVAQDFPKLTGRVVDQANLLDPQQEAALTAKLAGDGPHGACTISGWVEAQSAGWPARCWAQRIAICKSQRAKYRCSWACLVRANLRCCAASTA
jgi:hypothetical protein